MKTFKFYFYIFICILIFCCILYGTFAINSEPTIVEEKEQKKDFIKWVDFNVTYEVLEKTSKLDITSHNNADDIPLNWIELLSCLACKYGGNFKLFNQKDLDIIVQKIQKGTPISEVIENNKYYSYYFESYSAILSEFIGNYSIEILNEDGTKEYKDFYGIKAFLAAPWPGGHSCTGRRRSPECSCRSRWCSQRDSRRCRSQGPW